ncbi:hypothetical protein PROFUN_11348 [Planoprotostelium fungivorum]|uniref:G-patch domain-containing protein n=1 Tax=Planoprotostelium fungivorum TaxID=1890364 RepID=A0A2P6NAD2_9EUKA|nr:hypothetical protein PROFUN_11348 [Planoprotostelium fungivorum]
MDEEISFVRTQSPIIEGFKRTLFVRSEPEVPVDEDCQIIPPPKPTGEDISNFYLSLTLKLPPPLEDTSKKWICEECGESIDHNVSKEQHESAFSHRLSTHGARKQYHIQESNKGYRMLKNMSWNEEQGLGARNQGTLDPIKTQLRRDKSGLGKKDLPYRVTHFPNQVPLQKSIKKDRISQRDLEAMRKERDKIIKHAVYH